MLLRDGHRNTVVEIDYIKGNLITEETIMKRLSIYGIVFVSLVVIGCAKEQIYRSTPSTQRVSTSDFEVELEPLKAEGFEYYNRFRYQFTNKTDRDLVIDWSNCFYLQNGKRFGQFGWEGLTFEQLRGIIEEPDVAIAPGAKDAVEIFPLQLIGWREPGVRKKANIPEEGFTLGVIPAGENGLSIAVIKDGKTLRKRVLVIITQE